MPVHKSALVRCLRKETISKQAREMRSSPQGQREVFMAKDLNNLKVAILVADGFEQKELAEPREALMRREHKL
jgi:hypothetical protein